MTYNIVIETDRLILRNFTIDDAPLIYQLNSDPEVTRYTLDSIRNIQSAKEILEQRILPQYVLYNYGRWAVQIKPQLDPIAIGFIGWCGLKYRPELNEVDLGYRYIKSYWGKGYATEAAFASIKYGFEKLHLPRIVGRALPGNTASCKVLEKCGMHYMGIQVVEGMEHKTYEIFNPLNP